MANTSYQCSIPFLKVREKIIWLIQPSESSLLSLLFLKDIEARGIAIWREYYEVKANLMLSFLFHNFQDDSHYYYHPTIEYRPSLRPVPEERRGLGETQLCLWPNNSKHIYHLYDVIIPICVLSRCSRCLPPSCEPWQPCIWGCNGDGNVPGHSGPFPPFPWPQIDSTEE